MPLEVMKQNFHTFQRNFQEFKGKEHAMNFEMWMTFNTCCFREGLGATGTYRQQKHLTIRKAPTKGNGKIIQ